MAGQKPSAVCFVGRAFYGQFRVVLPHGLRGWFPASLKIIITLTGVHGGTLQKGLPVIPGHPIRRILLQLRYMPLQLRQVVERIRTRQLASVDQTHIQVAHSRSIPSLIEQRVLAMKNGFLQPSFANVKRYDDFQTGPKL